ncbi:uncharacterized protein EV420DRAFT_1061630 [Desarmillaria tabescens]|uniref:Uncharacterized protein n=1 Tax=Armillaria tabescens TaxID=1929756 RepID=A0AA39NFL7_ARMTA|nr:uncharacterized protein EV420DRAFT_1061630 [Desarmillaria tabescens]KAK0464733.1 hypothetical protein EV420DRAFT_1061630 [Desarmillaria tabescens]
MESRIRLGNWTRMNADNPILIEESSCRPWKIADDLELHRHRWINPDAPILIEKGSLRRRRGKIANNSKPSRRRRNASPSSSSDNNELPSSSSSLLTEPSGPNDDAFFIPWPDWQKEATMAGVSYQEASLDVCENVLHQVSPPDLVQCEGSPSTPSTSDTEGEATPTPQNLSTQTTPSNGKCRRSSSPPSPGSHSTSPTVHTKPESIRPDPSQTNEGTDIHRAKRVRMGEPADEDVLTSPPGKIPTP